MKNNWNSRTKTNFLIMIAIGGLLFDYIILRIIINICNSETTIFNIVSTIGMITFLIVFNWLGIATVLIRTQKYKVNEAGITVKFFTGKEYTFGWNEISEISVCDVFHATKGDTYSFVIRCVIGEEQDGPQNKNCSKNIYGYENWRKEIYHMRRVKEIIVIEYSEEKYLEIKDMSKMQIKDYRKPHSSAWKINIPN